MKTLTDCLYDTIHQSNKSIEVIAEEIGVSSSYLYNSARPDQEDSDTGTGCRFPLKKLIPLVRSTRNYCTLDHIENALGRVAITIPTGNESLDGIYKLTMQAVQEFGELMSEVSKSVTDGRLKSRERERIELEGYEAIQAIVALIEAVKISK
jgi:hypothetical protein